MSHTILRPWLFLIAIFLFAAFACNLPENRPQISAPLDSASPVPPMPLPVVPTDTPVIVHLVTPAPSPGFGRLVYDVDCSGTAPEKRAPYGDAYKINRLERPFQQDMTYISDLDIVTYNLSDDDTWIYVSIELVGTNPNNDVGISYGVEIDEDADGFGDTIIWAQPPYTPIWDVVNVKVLADRNHDTGGLSAEKSDAPLSGDGYETTLFNGGVGDDPDLAWVRVNAGIQATVQFAFKRSLTDGAYMLGVLADAGLKDARMLDYVDRYTEAEAGSPERGEEFYPLKALHSVDNACREAFGFIATGYEPQLCPRDDPTPQPRSTQPTQCQPPPYCTGVHYIWDPVTCTCTAIPW